MRNANHDPFKAFVVMPDGGITATYFGVGVESPFVSYEVFQGQIMPALKPWAKRAGVRLLEDVYADDPNSTIKDEGFRVFKRWWNGEFGHGKEAAGLIEGWLPASVRALREEHRRADKLAAAKMPAAPANDEPAKPAAPANDEPAKPAAPANDEPAKPRKAAR